MPVYREEEPVERVYRVEEEPVIERAVVERPVERRVVRRDSGDGPTSYALVRYGFILAITIIILWFLGKYFIPTFF